MNRNALTLMRAAVGIVVLLTLVVIVRGWWTDYQDRPSGASSGASSTTATIDPASSTESSTLDSESTEEAPQKQLTVLIDGLNLREKPAIDSKAIRGLKKKETVSVVELKGDWYRVTTSKDEEGWISANPNYTQVKKK